MTKELESSECRAKRVRSRMLLVDDDGIDCADDARASATAARRHDGGDAGAGGDVRAAAERRLAQL